MPNLTLPILRDRRESLYGPVAILLVSKPKRPATEIVEVCHRKKPYSFNTASEIATDFWEAGDFGIQAYFCLVCRRFHVGHIGNGKAHRYICVWCGARIRGKQKYRHAQKCGRIITDQEWSDLATELA